jgi:probable phosphoglycerate mutase
VFLRHGEAACIVAEVVGGPATCTGLTAHGRTHILGRAARW